MYIYISVKCVRLGAAPEWTLEASFLLNVSNKTCFLLCFFQVGFRRPSKAFQVRPLKAFGGLQKAFGGLRRRFQDDFGVDFRRFSRLHSAVDSTCNAKGRTLVFADRCGTSEGSLTSRKPQKSIKKHSETVS